MKKLLEYRKIGFIRRSLRAARRKLGEKNRRRARLTGQKLKRATGYWRGERRRMWVSAYPHVMPSVLCFDNNAEETIQFLGGLAQNLCHNYLKNKYRTRVKREPLKWYDFSQLEEISPSAGLVLAAEFDRQRLLTRANQVFTLDMDKWKSQPFNLLLGLGFLPLLGIDDSVIEPDEDAWIVRFRSDTGVNMAAASETLREVIEFAASAAVIGVGEDILERFRLFLTAIGEALNNTSDHAYPEDLDTELPNVGRWWITGAVSPRDKRLTFAVYDQGVTIPRAIPLGPRVDRVRRFVRKLTGRAYDPEDTSLDGHTIAAAVRVGVSGTGEGHRGRGLGLMRDYIRGDRTGRLRIVSRNGEFVACTGRKDEFLTRTMALPGTFVEWTVNL